MEKLANGTNPRNNGFNWLDFVLVAGFS